MFILRTRVALIEVITALCLLVSGLPIQAQTPVAFPANAPQTSSKIKLAIVFVPGTAGSELRLTSKSEKIDDRLFWLGEPTFKKKAITRGSLDQCGNDLPGNEVKSPSALTAVDPPFTSEQTAIYSNFLAWAKDTFAGSFYVAPYDWRKGARAENSALLAQVIDKAFDDSGQQKVILLAHSLGGLVSRDYIVRNGSHKVAALIAVGTPWLGLPKTVRALVWGYNFEAGIVRPSKGRTRLKGLPPDYTSSMCNKDGCEKLNRFSLLKIEDVRKVAHNFPSVYQQLPTYDFMKAYGLAAGEPFKSVLWGRQSWEMMEELYKKSNPCLYAETTEWRKKFLHDRDVNVSHYLIGGIYAPECRNSSDKNCKIQNRMDMQMPDRNQVNRSNFSRIQSAIVAGLNVFFSIFGYSGPQRDQFIALDSGYEWGDGTTPLLSATAGEYVTDVNNPTHRERAKAYVGPDVETRAVSLGPKYGHSAMLDDPKVREAVVSYYRKESEERNVNTDFVKSVNEVESIRIEISAESYDPKERVKTALIGKGVNKLQNSKQNEEMVIDFKDFQVEDPVLFLPKPKHNSKPVPALRQLLTSDLPRLTLEIRNTISRRSEKKLRIRSLRVIVNGITKFEERDFEVPPGGKPISFSLGQ